MYLDVHDFDAQQRDRLRQHFKLDVGRKAKPVWRRPDSSLFQSIYIHKLKTRSFVRNDHTTVTTPLPVCSAKLSTVGPS